MTTHKPITDRFNRYSKEDARADALFDRYRDCGGALLHEMPPSIQEMVYHLAAVLEAADEMRSSAPVGVGIHRFHEAKLKYDRAREKVPT